MAYVYRITHKETNEYYIGFNKGNRTIGVDYFTSSDYVTFSRDTVDDWTIDILYEDDDQDIVWRKEQVLIQEHINEPLCLNRHYHTSDSLVMRPPWEDPEFKDYHREQCWKRYKDPEARRKTSEAVTKSWQDIERRKTHSKRLRKQWRDPEARRRHSERMKEKYKDPEARRRTAEATKAAMTPERLAAKRALRKPKASCIVCRKELAAAYLAMHSVSKSCKKR